MSDIIKIVVVDDHAIFLKGLSLLINECPDFKVVGEANNGIQFLELLEKMTPDLVLMDIKMPLMDGIEATEKALIKFPDLKIMTLTMFSEHKYLRLMAEAGVNGFILKSIGKRELEQAIKTVVAGKTYFSPEVMEDISKWETFTRSGIFLEDMNERLSEREVDVLQEIVKGLSTQEIADKLFISKRTVEGHRANLIAKTATRNVVDLVIYAIRKHLVSI